MTDVAVPNDTIFPSANDVAAVAGDGKLAYERNLQRWLQGAIGIGGPALFANRVITGLRLLPGSTNLDQIVQAGQALLSTRWVDIPETTLTSLAASSTVHVYLKLSRDGNQNATGAVLEHNTTGVKPADSVYLGTATTNGSQVTAVTDKRTFGRCGTLDFCVGLLPDGALAIDGTEYNATTYENLFDYVLGGLTSAPWFTRGTAVGNPTFDNTTDTWTLNGHGMANGTVVHLSSTTSLPTGYNTLQKYFVVNQATNTYQLAHKPGGAVVNGTSNGSGTLSVYKQFKGCDPRGRKPIAAGAGAGLTNRVLGTSGGHEELQAHAHNVKQTDGFAGEPVSASNSTANTPTLGTTESTGAGNAGNMDPWMAFNFYVWP